MAMRGIKYELWSPFAVGLCLSVSLGSIAFNHNQLMFSLGDRSAS